MGIRERGQRAKFGPWSWWTCVHCIHGRHHPFPLAVPSVSVDIADTHFPPYKYSCCESDVTHPSVRAINPSVRDCMRPIQCRWQLNVHSDTKGPQRASEWASKRERVNERKRERESEIERERKGKRGRERERERERDGVMEQKYKGLVGSGNAAICEGRVNRKGHTMKL